jgi:hypothetical protein
VKLTGGAKEIVNVINNSSKELERALDKSNIDESINKIDDHISNSIHRTDDIIQGIDLSTIDNTNISTLNKKINDIGDIATESAKKINDILANINNKSINILNESIASHDKVAHELSDRILKGSDKSILDAFDKLVDEAVFSHNNLIKFMNVTHTTIINECKRKNKISKKNRSVEINNTLDAINEARIILRKENNKIKSSLKTKRKRIVINLSKMRKIEKTHMTGGSTKITKEYKYIFNILNVLLGIGIAYVGLSLLVNGLDVVLSDVSLGFSQLLISIHEGLGMILSDTKVIDVLNKMPVFSVVTAGITISIMQLYNYSGSIFEGAYKLLFDDEPEIDNDNDDNDNTPLTVAYQL